MSVCVDVAVDLCRLFAAKGYRMVNPLCPEPPPATAPLPRLSWDDKWLLYKRTRRPGYRQLLEELVETEDKLHKCVAKIDVHIYLLCIIVPKRYVYLRIIAIGLLLGGTILYTVLGIVVKWKAQHPNYAQSFANDQLSLLCAAAGVGTVLLGL